MNGVSKIIRLLKPQYIALLNLKKFSSVFTVQEYKITLNNWGWVGGRSANGITESFLYNEQDKKLDFHLPPSNVVICATNPTPLCIDFIPIITNAFRHDLCLHSNHCLRRFGL